MGLSKKHTRRQFLQTSALLGTSLFLPSCASLRGSFDGDTRNLKDEVVVLGAGAAGLAAAYTLKKNKIPFRLFEASPRVGGGVFILCRTLLAADKMPSWGLSFLMKAIAIFTNFVKS